ncbi:hypothetical protein BDY21DRAFT_393787 [Lineolata rhizophorae]|uniref:Armadillo-type protein n=1 Tax=Lineolata rhizophorae TaxID=578093 RepID=A0A6A6NYC0_9PEZI|nr:hypothetical protein BDY21DRAFT_393787 [Lineolata rhizophorae]
MGPSQRSEPHHMSINYLSQLAQSQAPSDSSPAATSPSDAPAGATRLGAGSPSHEFGSRLYSKRAREIQAQEGLGPQVWGPPTSGNSTPLRETIPESPNGESFPDFNAPPGLDSIAAGAVPSTTTRRTRAGTLPSRFSPATGLAPGLTPSSTLSKSSRPTPSTSPFKPGSGTPAEGSGFGQPPNNSAASKSALLSRLRAGSMPQRASFLSNNSNPFGPSVFSTNWGGARDRSTTLASIQSSNGPTSPSHSSFSKDGFNDTDVKTLDYLGLVDTPQQSRAQLAQPSDVESLLSEQRSTVGLQPAAIADLAALTKTANRFRSYSVNAKERYADEEEDDMSSMARYAANYSGSLTPSAEGNAAAYAIQEAVRQHNLEVQAFANFATANRPRARTAGVLDSPSTRILRSYMPTPSRLDSSMSASDMQVPEEAEFSGLTEAAMDTPGATGGDENTLEGPTRALWLGNIPPSTTVSSITHIFGEIGPIESSRVLTHKNCAFVNFENVADAMRAKALKNGTEVFPGAGPVRIGYAKVPSASATPNTNGLYPSPSPDPMAKGADGASANVTGSRAAGGGRTDAAVGAAAPPPSAPALPDIRDEILHIVKELGSTEVDGKRIEKLVTRAVEFDDYRTEIPPIGEPSHNRMHDAPRLREIRKRIDNNACTQAEIEDIAMGMLPEIAELSSDYLGNTVVQKLFEFCGEPTKEAMFEEIAPHMAEIGVHKNGTWAAQKIIDSARSERLKQMIVDSLRPYGMALFLDQFGNYVMQGCLRYGSPLNDFIFETMLSRLWELAQGRFGARAMRACLESHSATKDQQRAIAASIALHSVQLATNANGALLLTWFLDTCTFPRRRTVLAPRLVPHLVHLCTHKVAYLTVLKLINQRNEVEARDTILQALFFSPNDQVLEAILSDQACGATLIFKVLTTPFFDDKIRPEVVQNVRNVLLRIKAVPAQGYKRLMDEVGLRDGHHHHHHEGSRPGSKHSSAAPRDQQQPASAAPPADPSTGRPLFYPGMPGPQGPAAGPYSAAGADLQRSGSVDSTGYDAFPTLNGAFPPGMGAPGPMGAPAPGPMGPGYQQAAMLAAAAAGRSGAGAGFYPPGMGFDANAFRGAGNGNGGAATSVPPGLGGMGAGAAAGAPMMPQAGGFAGPQAFGMMNGGGGGGGGMYYPMQYMGPQQQQQPMQQQVGGRSRARMLEMRASPAAAARG